MTTGSALTWRGVAAAVLLGLATLVGVATFRLWSDGRRHFEEAESLVERGEGLRAVVRYEDSARAYFPGNPYPPRALKQLAIMAKAQEMRGDTREAAATWEVVRRSILATRHFRQPNQHRLSEAERELARLQAPVEDVRGTTASPTSRPVDPSPTASLLLFAGLLAWIGGALALCLLRRGPENQARRRRQRLVAWLACLGGLALWLAMSWLAG